ncbi:hypothetical protein DFQ29_005207 [Apophysomyces sp. BC1021]|nr:hypothetical protein DFQ29_005207 [Apophysomyces sp. BC1021]
MESVVDLDLWSKASQGITWTVPPSAPIAYTGSGPHPYVWFPGGRLNTCYNCVDRHVLTTPNQAALVWDSPVTNSKVTYTYAEVLDHVTTLAGLLYSYGVRKADTVLIYMPMVPEAAFALLACARLGAVHSVVFGGFAPKELAKRIDDSKPKVVLTASCGIEPKRVIPYKPLLEAAMGMTGHTVPITLVLQRLGRALAHMDHAKGDRDFAQEMERTRREKRQFKDCVEVASEDPLYVLYTSGTTGQPKGVVRSNGGHAVVLNWSMQYVFGVKKGDAVFTASDIGWAVSHSYTVYGPMLAGVTTVLYEGKPVNTPDAGAFWRVASEYGVKAMFTAPTAVRAIRREDPDGVLAKRYDLSNLRALFVAGERSDPETLHWCQNIVGDQCLVIDNYWMGSPVTATCMGAHPIGPTKPGSAGKQVPGSIICVLTEGTNKEAGPNEFGNVVLKLPLPPAAFPSLWKNEDGYKSSYFDKYPGYYDTGDAGMIDDEGYVHVMSRTDDIINVAGHRLSTGSIEEILTTHPMVAECCVVPLPDRLKGHVPLGILVLKHIDKFDFDALLKDLIFATRRDLGAIACFDRAVVVPRLPKTRSGKVLRRCVRDMVEGREVKVPATIEDETVLEEIEEILQKEGLIPHPVRAKL